MKLRTMAHALIASAAALGALEPSDADASVSIAVGFEALVKDADDVALVTPSEAHSVWEDGRIYTYTKVKIDQGVAGSLGPGAEGYVRTMGGVVGKIGQMVDGEAVLTGGKPALLFMRKLGSGGGAYEVAARAQGQYPVLVDELKKTRRLVRAAGVGVLLPPKPVENASGLRTQSTAATTELRKVNIRLAQDVMHERPVDDAVREIAATWQRLHPTPAK